MAKAYLSIGSNSGPREKYLTDALDIIRKTVGRIVTESAIYETESWGYSGENFLNMVVCVETDLNPVELMDKTKEAEKSLGRIKTPGMYSDRTIDIDIIFYDDRVFTGSNLEIPHPRMQHRLFVLVPLADIDPFLEHPVLKVSVKELFAQCDDNSWIKVWERKTPHN